MKTEHKIKYCKNCNFILSSDSPSCTKCEQPVVMEQMDIFIGRTFDKYVVEEIIGAGGMGIVFKGKHKFINHYAAIKMILPTEIDDVTLKRFKRESRMLGKMKHNNIVNVYSADFNEYGFPYYIMEYLEGASLRDIIKQHNAPLPVERTYSIMYQLLEGLSYAHELKIIHRDLKPENIFLTEKAERETLKILDFGIAKRTQKDASESEASAASLTVDGSALGTPLYMSPEQLLGKEVGFYSDVYSCGLILYEMLSGTQAVEGKTLSEVVFCHLNEAPTKKVIDLTGVSEALKGFLKQCLTRDPEDRFPDAVKMKAAFESTFASISSMRETSTELKRSTESESEKPEASIPASIKEEQAKDIPEPRPEPAVLSEKLSFYKKNKLLFFIIMAVIIALGIGLFVYLKEPAAAKRDAGIADSLPEAGDAKRINITSAYTVPSDTVELLEELRGTEYNYWLLKGENKYYIWDHSANSLILTIPMLEDRILLGAVEENGDMMLAWMQNSTFIMTTPELVESTKINIDEGVWSGGAYDNDTRFLCLYNESKLQTYLLKNQTFKKVCTYDMSTVQVISDHNSRYVAIAGKGALEIFGMEDCTFKREIPLADTVLNAVKLHATNDIIAYSGISNNVSVFNFQSMEMEYETSLPGRTLSLEFLYKFPALLILKEQSLYLCDTTRKKCEGELTSAEQNFYRLSYLSQSKSLYLVSKSPKEIIELGY